MAKGRAGAMRLHAVQQATLVWADARAEQIDQFVQTGRMDEAKVDWIPYDPQVLAQLQAKV